MKKRLDQILVERGHAPTRARAQALILAGNVLVNDEPKTKAGESVAEDVIIRLRQPDHPYVSRGGLKLEAALKEFQLDVNGKIALDIGASTGGFTDVLLKNGAQKVIAVDVGKSQMDWSLRQNPKVVLLEGVNARTLTPDLVGEKPGIIVVDLSFIGLAKVIPALIDCANEDTDWVTLIKPQFEAGPEKVGKGGIVRDPLIHEEVINTVTVELESLGLCRLGLIKSPIQGTDGNQEFLAKWKLKSEK